jgi:hypothetical protein
MSIQYNPDGSIKQTPNLGPNMSYITSMSPPPGLSSTMPVTNPQTGVPNGQQGLGNGPLLPGTAHFGGRSGMQSDGTFAPDTVGGTGTLPFSGGTGSPQGQGNGFNSSNLIDQLIQAINNPSNTGQPQMTAAPGANNTTGLQPFLNSPMYQALYGNKMAQQAQQTGNFDPTNALFNTSGYQALYGNRDATQSLNGQYNPMGSLLNSANYQAMFGGNAANSFNQTGQFDPTQAFREDPGFQFMQEQTANDLQRHGAAKGILESGPMQVELQRQLQNNQNLQYQTFLNQQNGLLNQQQANTMGLNQQNQSQMGGLYQSYQQQLAALMGMGSQNTGANQYYQNGQALGPLLGQFNQQTGQLIGQGQIGAGNNISEILANQGIYNGNAYLNTGAAIANQMTNYAGMNAQINNNNQQSAAQQYSSQLAGQGYQNGISRMQSAGGGVGPDGNPVGQVGSSYYGNPWGYKF